MWQYEVSGKRVLTQWFSYRKKNRERPIIGDRRPPSKLGDIQPDHWLAEYTTELLNVLHVLALLVEMEPAQAKLLEAICGGPTLDYPSMNSGPPALSTCPRPGGSRFKTSEILLPVYLRMRTPTPRTNSQPKVARTLTIQRTKVPDRRAAGVRSSC